VIRDDGTPGGAHARTLPMLGADGEIVKCSGTARDITERKQVSEALLENETFRLLVGNVPALLWFNGPNGAEFVNRGYLEYLGVEQRDVGGYDWAQFVHPDDREPYVKGYQQAFAERRAFEAEFRFRRHDGEYRWMKSVGHPRIGPGGELVGYVGISFDITMRKQAEAAGREAESRFAAEAAALARLNELSSRLWRMPSLNEGLKEMLHATVSLLGADMGNIQLMEGRTLRIVAQQGFGAAFLDYMREASLENDSACARAFRSSAAVMIEDVEADEGYAPLRPVARQAGYRAVFSTPLIGHDGDTLGMVTVHFGSPHCLSDQDRHRLTLYVRQAADFIERCRADEALRQSEARLASLFDALPIGVGITDLDGKVLVANWEMSRYLPTGVIPSRDDAQAGRWRATHPDGRPVDRADYPGARAMRGERVVPGLEFRYLQDDGREMWTQVAAVPLRNPDGRIDGHAVAITDIDATKQAEAALRESEERFHALADNMDQLAWMADPAGAILWFNRRWYDYTGAGVGDVDAENWGKLVHPEHAPRVVERSRRFLTRGEAWEDTFPLKGRTGEYRWFLRRAVPIKDDEGRLLRWFGTFTDVTELKERNAQLQRLSAQLTAIEQHERRKLANTLHDGLQQLIVAAKLQLPLCLEEDGAEQMQRIDRQLDQAIDAVRSLAWELSPPAVGTSTLPEALEWLAEWFHRQSGFYVRIRIPEALPPLAEHAKALLFSAVRELLLNCIKHSGTHAGTVELRADVHELRMVVADEGAGFDPAKLAYGFGLSSIRERLVALGGRLIIESAPGAGARFTLSLPLPEASGP
jgi:PAS domain S-box-containing protein